MEAQRAAAESFAGELRALRDGVGNPSFRKMAGRSGRISHTTLHEAAAGSRFPSWETTREFVRACDADEAEWRSRWEEAQLTSAPPATSELVLPAGRALQLAQRPRPVAPADIPRARRRWWGWLAAAVVLALAAVLGATLHSRSRGKPGVAATSSPADSSGALIPGDASRFVGDVTIPDGTKVKVNAHFVKVWAIANVGVVPWHDRFLAPTEPASADDDGCRVPARVAIGDTLPGEQVMISVPVTAPSRPGRCWVSWKMVDDRGRAYFPSRRPVYFLVTVTS